MTDAHARAHLCIAGVHQGTVIQTSQRRRGFPGTALAGEYDATFRQPDRPGVRQKQPMQLSPLIQDDS